MQSNINEILRRKAIWLIKKCYYHKSTQKLIKSNDIRSAFVDFFIEKHNHKYVRSSPVVPFSDPTLAFVNAGMNQFKGIFLDKENPKFPRVTNSQKCIRIGGKHNDLSLVGHDAFHHTFFEMLGNWSFGDYFKTEACRMALELLTETYGIDINRLYFTYFAGDKQLGLESDLETMEIWKNLGVPATRILPFGSADNFWEMGKTGPCGTCTEIHYDHASTQERLNLVNTGRPDLTEIWNIVFIEYNRNSEGKLSKLTEKHIDTGMGLERLVRVLQHKDSNYDTDLFTPIFQKIQKVTNAPQYTGKFENNELDIAYRIIADHSRMITACLSDGMLPEKTQKLRRLLRTAILLSENTFKTNNLLSLVIPSVVDILGTTYPEMRQKLDDTIQIIKYEEEVFKEVRANAMQEYKLVFPMNDSLVGDIEAIEFAGFVPAYKDLKLAKSKFLNNQIPSEFLFKMHDTYGLSIQAINKLAKMENLELNENTLEEELLKAKEKSKISIYATYEDMQKVYQTVAKLPPDYVDTNDYYKYSHYHEPLLEMYKVPILYSTVAAIIKADGTLVEKVITNTNDLFYILTPQTSFYYESGGQVSDKGSIKIYIDDEETIDYDQHVNFIVEDVKFCNGKVLHVGKFDKNDMVVEIKNNVELIVDSNHRSQNIYNHSATHLLNAAVRNLYNKVTYQISSNVTPDFFKLELGIIGKKINREDIEQIEKLIRNVIMDGCSMDVKDVSESTIIHDQTVTIVPGEIYPAENLRLLKIISSNYDFYSKELCCGTHARNTKHLKDFCILNLKQPSRARFVFTGAAGDVAEKALNLADVYLDGIEKLENELKNDPDKHLQINIEIQKLKNNLTDPNIILPYVFKMDALERVNNLLKQMKDASRTTLKEFIEIEMKNVLENQVNSPFVIHFLNSSTLVESVPLEKATKLCVDRPIIVISLNDGMVKARCCVPETKVNSNFNASKWLDVFANVFKGKIAAPKTQNEKLICNMKSKRITSTFDEQLEEAIKIAKNYAEVNM